MSATHSISNRLDTIAERRLSWLLPGLAIVACVAIAWQSSPAILVAEPKPAARRLSFTVSAGEQISAMKPVVDFDHAAPDSLVNVK